MFQVRVHGARCGGVLSRGQRRGLRGRGRVQRRPGARPWTGPHRARRHRHRARRHVSRAAPEATPRGPGGRPPQPVPIQRRRHPQPVQHRQRPAKPDIDGATQPDLGDLQETFTPHPHRARCSAAQRQKWKMFHYLHTAAASTCCVNTTVVSIFCAALCRRNGNANAVFMDTRCTNNSCVWDLRSGQWSCVPPQMQTWLTTRLNLQGLGPADQNPLRLHPHRTRNSSKWNLLGPIDTGPGCDARRKLECFSFDVACEQCGYPHSHQQVPFACIALCIASCILCGLGLNVNGSIHTARQATSKGLHLTLRACPVWIGPHSWILSQNRTLSS